MGLPAEKRPGAEEPPSHGMTGGPPPGTGRTPMDDFITFLCEAYPIWKRKQEQKCNSQDSE